MPTLRAPLLAPPRDLPSRPPKTFVLFSLSRSHFRSFSLSGGLLVEFWWCLKRRDTQMCTFGLSGCRAKPRRLLQNVKDNFTIDLPPLRLPKKSMTNYYNFCLYPKKKKDSNTTERNSTGRRPPPSHLRDPHLLAFTFSELLFVLFVLLLFLLHVAAFLVAYVPVAACCCRCLCCCLCLFLLFVQLLLYFFCFCCCLCLFAACGPPTVEPPPPPLQCLTFQQILLVSHRMSTGRRSSSPPRGPTPLGLNFSGFAPPHSGLLAAVVV